MLNCKNAFNPLTCHTLRLTLADMKRPQVTPMFTFRLSAELQEALKRAAEADDRTSSALARKIIADWLRRQGKTSRN